MKGERRKAIGQWRKAMPVLSGVSPDSTGDASFALRSGFKPYPCSFHTDDWTGQAEGEANVGIHCYSERSEDLSGAKWQQSNLGLPYSTMDYIYANIPTFIREVADRVAIEYIPQRIILFGSYAWGKPEPDSDVDLLIVKETTENPRERRTFVYDLLWEHPNHRPIDFIVLTPAEIERRISMGDVFCRMIVEEGKVIYDA